MRAIRRLKAGVCDWCLLVCLLIMLAVYGYVVIRKGFTGVTFVVSHDPVDLALELIFVWTVPWAGLYLACIVRKQRLIGRHVGLVAWLLPLAGGIAVTGMEYAMGQRGPERPGGDSLVWAMAIMHRGWALMAGVAAAVGLASLDMLARKLSSRNQRALCRSCGYDLTGNVSGRCPECGEFLRYR